MRGSIQLSFCYCRFHLEAQLSKVVRMLGVPCAQEAYVAAPMVIVKTQLFTVVKAVKADAMEVGWRRRRRRR
jgi:hypothetical protein